MRSRAAVILASLVALVAVVGLPAVPRSGAATIPSGFSDTLVASAGSPTALAFTPDGRMLVATKAGRLLVARGGTIAGTAALDISARVCAESERGLVGVAVDPAFATNAFVYLYYTATNGVGACPLQQAAWPVNRVTRVALGANDVVDPASEVILFNGIPSVAGNHNGGDLAFGPDGMLYVSIGDGGCDYAALSSCGLNNDASRDTNVALGKILRISPVDGSAPPGNPFVGSQPPCRDDGFTAVGNHCPETWAWGFRNPFRFAFGPVGRLYVNDVGQVSAEEIDDVQAGRDYGWNLREGTCLAGSTTDCPAPPTELTDPVLAYGRADGCRSITGGAFAPASWPETYRGDYLFADFACGKIFQLEGSTRVDFATALGANSAVHLEIGLDDALYYTTFAGGGQVRRLAPLAPLSGTVFVSDLAWVSATNGYGPVERDASNGHAAAGDGGPLRLDGVVAAKGLGVHAPSTVTYALSPGSTSFLADVGVDDECGTFGTVVFEVLVNGVNRFDSGTMSGASATRPVVVDVTGASQLALRVTDAGDGGACDHADWANARVVGATTSSSTTSVPTTTPPTTPLTTPLTTPTTTSPLSGTVFVSDLAWVSATNGYGPVERDASNGQAAAGDGGPLRLDGVVAAKGLGVHSPSSVTYALSGGLTSFRADVGVDDECGTFGTVVFQVFVNGVKRFDSGTMRGTAATKSVVVDVTGATQLLLTVTDAGDGGACDHADWANARVVGGATPPTTPPSPPPASVFVSDLAWVSATNGYGPVERDASNGQAAAGDGGPLRLDGVVAAKGLGVHSPSSVTYALSGGLTSFRADVGVDDECGTFGTVVFQVFVNGVKRFDSGTMRGTAATKSVVVDVTGATQLLLTVTDAGDGSACDHADWANALLS